MQAPMKGPSAAALVGLALALAGCGSSGTSSPQKTLTTFLHAAASGDGAKACAQLTVQAQSQIVRGLSCAQGMKLASGLYGPIIKRITITDLKTQGNAASGITMVNGKPMARFHMTKSGGRWMIDGEQNPGS